MEFKQRIEEITDLRFRDFFTNPDHDERGVSTILDFAEPGAPKKMLADVRIKIRQSGCDCVAFLGEGNGRDVIELVVIPKSDIVEAAEMLVPLADLHIDKSDFLERLREWEETLEMNIIQMSHQIFGFEIAKQPADLQRFCLQVFELWPTIFDPEDLITTSDGLTLKKDSYFQRWLCRDMVVEGFWES